MEPLEVHGQPVRRPTVCLRSQWQLSKRFCERDVFRSNVPLIQISVGSGLERVPLSDSLPSAGVSLRGG